MAKPDTRDSVAKETAARECQEEPEAPAERLYEQYGRLHDLQIATSLRLDRLAMLFVPVQVVLLIVFSLTFGHFQDPDLEPLVFVDLRLMPAILLLTAMMLDIVWIALALRLQMSLKLFHFQMRRLERKLDLGLHGPALAADRFWSGRSIDCEGGEEKIRYPNTAEGRVGRIASKVWTWFAPGWFFFVSLFCFLGWMTNLSRFVN